MDPELRRRATRSEQRQHDAEMRGDDRRQVECVGCGEVATTDFDGVPSCDRCHEVLERTWPEGRIAYQPLTPVEGNSILADIITGRAR